MIKEQQLEQTRMVWKPHTTVAAIIERDNTFLMVKELIDGQQVINQPAGHLEEGESLVQSVIREVQEETAWLFEPHAILGIYRWQHPQNQRTYMRTSFIGDVTQHKPSQPLDDGIISADWYSRDQLERLNLRSPMVLRTIDDYLSGQQYPLELLQNV